MIMIWNLTQKTEMTPRTRSLESKKPEKIKPMGKHEAKTLIFGSFELLRRFDILKLFLFAMAFALLTSGLSARLFYPFFIFLLQTQARKRLRCNFAIHWKNKRSYFAICSTSFLFIMFKIMHSIVFWIFFCCCMFCRACTMHIHSTQTHQNLN